LLEYCEPMVLQRVLAACRAWVDAPFARHRTRETLFSFASPRALDKWHVYSDEQDGGLSTVDWRHEERDGGVGVFSGRIETGFDESLEQGDRATPASFTGATMVRSGYAAVRSLEPAPFGELSDFDGLALTIRSDSRPYVVNLKTDRLMADTQELYQLIIPPSPPPPSQVAWQRPRPLEPFERGPWREVRMPWESFKLTWRGFVQPQAITLDPRKIESIGIALFAADRDHADIGYAAMFEGPFVFEIQTIDAYGAGGEGKRSGGDVERTTQTVLRALPPGAVPAVAAGSSDDERQ
jgi:hypothetical protein